MAKAITDNEMFMSLFLLAKDDDKLRVKLESILREDDVSRISLINNWIGGIEKKLSNQALLSALESLKLPGVAYKALKLLSK